MILRLHRTMDLKAVTLVIDDQLMDVSEIPFPAVTIFGSFPTVAKLRFPEMQSPEEFDYNADNLDTEREDYVPDVSEFETVAHPTSRFGNSSVCL